MEGDGINRALGFYLLTYIHTQTSEYISYYYSRLNSLLIFFMSVYEQSSAMMYNLTLRAIDLKYQRGCYVQWLNIKVHFWNGTSL